MKTLARARRAARSVLLACAAVAAVACGSRDPATPTPTTGASQVVPSPTPPPTPPPPATAAEAPTPTATTPSDPEATVMAEAVPRLPSRAVCVEQSDGTFRAARVQASIAGVYDPGAPLRLAHMNWMAPGLGCVSYPGASTRAVACGAAGEPPAPLVTRTLCQQ